MRETASIVKALRMLLAEAADSDGVTLTLTSNDTVEITSSPDSSSRKLTVRVRGIADFEVAFFVPTKPGSPFEQVFTGLPNEAPAVVQAVVDFVNDLLAEEVVLAYDARHLMGGRRFLKARDLVPSLRRHLSWVVSWRGTYDWTR